MVSRKGFTLIELMVTVAIIVLLMAMMVPWLGKARDQAKLVRCGANLKGIGTAIFMYAGNHDDIVPNGAYYVAYPLSYWPEELVADGVLNVASPCMEATGPNGPCWATGRGIFHCPSYIIDDHDLTGDPGDTPKDLNEQYAGNATYGIGYFAGSILWGGGSSFPIGSDLPLRARNVMRTAYWNPGHIVAADAKVDMFKRGSITGANQEDVKLRHFKGANYLFGDNHVEWNKLYQLQLIEGEDSIWRHNPWGVRGYNGG